MTTFSSEGFDLDAITSATGVLELGGKVVQEEVSPVDEPTRPAPSSSKAATATSTTPISPAEAWKRQGNDAFVNKDWERALSLYTEAINATPGLTGADLLKLQREWQEEQSRIMREQLRQRDTDRAAKKAAKATGEKETEEDDDGKKDESPAKFQAPAHPHGMDLAVYYSNRAAAALQIAQEEGPPSTATTASPYRESASFDDDDDEKAPPPVHARLEEAVQDCTVALLLNPGYVKALVRRCTAYERSHNTEAALADALLAQRLEPSNASVRATVVRLQKLEDERVEKLKTETFAKLKDLGNSILGNFGLSLDNFNAQKDPNTGSYSISFNQK